MTRKNTFFEKWSWFKFNNLRLTQGEALNFYTSEAKGLKIKPGKFLGLIRAFVEVAVEKPVGALLLFHNHSKFCMDIDEVAFSLHPW